MGGPFDATPRNHAPRGHQESTMQDSFGIRDTLSVDGKSYQIANFAKLGKQ